MVMEVKVDPNNQLSRALARARKESADLTAPLTLIAQSWFKTNKAIFALRGPGQYEPLSPKYREQKAKKLGFVYPALLGRNERIKKAITDPTDSNSVNKILNKKELQVGVRKTGSFPYAAVHQFGSGNIPARPYLFVGGEAAAPKDLNKRSDIWAKLIETHILKTTNRAL